MVGNKLNLTSNATPSGGFVGTVFAPALVLIQACCLFTMPGARLLEIHHLLPSKQKGKQ